MATITATSSMNAAKTAATSNMNAVKSAATGSMTAAKSAAVSCSNTACTWIVNTTKSAGNAVNAIATKVAALFSAAFQALARNASAVACNTKNFANATLTAMKANPQIAIGGVALVVLLSAAALYAYTQRAAV